MSTRVGSAVAGPLVQLADVTKAYGEGAGRTPVLAGIALDLARGSTTSLVGVSGSGKSTLVAVLAGLVPPDAGVVLFDGQDLATMGESARARLRAGRIGVVVQRGNLIPFLTASENVVLAQGLAGRRNGSARRARTLLSELGLANRLGHLPHQLSGGELRRVGLAMALAKEPLLLIGDEITGELDSGTAERVMELVLHESNDRALTLLFVTHDDRLAGMAQTRMRLDGGYLRPA